MVLNAFEMSNDIMSVFFCSAIALLSCFMWYRAIVADVL